MDSIIPRRYRTISRLGRGGQGEVWLVSDRQRDDALLALKVLTGPAWIDRYEELSREFLLLHQLRHPNIARVRDFGRLDDDRGAYLTVDHVPGADLLTWLGGVAPAARWALLEEVAAQALSALRYLGLRGVQHGDIKPTNLLVAATPGASGARLKIIDFGASVIARGPGRGAPRWGTRLYSPPVSGLDADLYGLGLSLYQAAAGRLPFPPGDPGAIRGWWEAGSPARVSAVDPSVPPSLDHLIEGILRQQAAGCRSAAEALATLERGSLAPSVRRPPLDAVPSWPPGLERLVQSLTELACDAGPGPRIGVIVGPHGSGKSRLLEATAARLQVLGYQCHIFRGTSDAVTLEGLEASIPGGVVNGDAWPLTRDASGSLERLAATRLALLLDLGDVPGPPGAAASRAHDFLREAAAHFTRHADLRGRWTILGAGRSAAAVSEALGVEPREVQPLPVEPLGEAGIADMMRELFEVEEVPPGPVARLLRETQGWAARVERGLLRWRDAGAGVDALGCLVLPARLPPVGGAEDDDASLLASLGSQELRALACLAWAGEPMTAADASRLAGGDPLTWARELEGLRARGLVGRRERAADPLYVLLPSVPVAALELPDPDGERELRSSLARHHGALWRERLRVMVPTCLAASRNWRALGEPEAAAPWTLRALRSQRVDRDAAEDVREELWTVLRALRAARSVRRPRLLAVLELRLAELLIRTGRFAEVLEVLPRRAASWSDGRAAVLRAEALERLGREGEAIVELECLLALPPDREPVSIDAHGAEAQARLAALRFRRGQAEAANSSLQLGRRWLATPRELSGWTARSLVRVHGLFAAVESSHGDGAAAVRHLERALELSRSLATTEMSLGPLNELGILHARGQQWSEARRTFEEAEALARRRGDRSAALRAICNRAILHYRRQELDAAEAAFRSARGLSESMGPHALSPSVWLGFAGVLRERGRLAEALRMYRRIIRDRLGRTNDIAVAHNNVAEVYLRLGRLERALRHSVSARRLALRTRNAFLAALTLRTRGLVRLALGRGAAAAADLAAAVDLARSQRDERGASEALLYLAQVSFARGSPREAQALFRRARWHARRAGEPRRLAQSLGGTVWCLLARRGTDVTARRLGRLVAPLTELASLPARLQRHLLREGTELEPGALLGTLRSGVRDGDLWEVFFALTCLASCRELAAGTSRAALAVETEVVAARLLRRLAPRRRRQFRAFWLRGDASDAAAAPRAAEAPPRLLDRELRLPPAVSAIAQGESRLEDLLEDLRQRIGAEAVWLLQDPAHDRRGHLATRGSSGHVTDALLRGLDTSLADREVGQLVAAPPYLAVRLPNARASRILCASSGPRGWKAPRLAAAIFLERASTLALALELEDGWRALSGEKLRHEASRQESRRLSALLLEEKRELETAFLTQRLDGGARRWQGHAPGGAAGTLGLVAASKSLREIAARLPRLAALDLPVLITGESGVGKDLIARQLHDLGPRQRLPFLAELCDIPESLLEAELFGYEQGAFTGAERSHAGIFERAAGGTIYLDQIAELSPAIQASLLRVLEEKTVRPLGAQESRPVAFRLVSASKRPLSQLQTSPQLRKDLLYRVYGEVIEIPPLRDRKEDIPALVSAALDRYAGAHGATRPYLHPGAEERLLAHEWPGNVRELLHELERVLVSKPEVIRAELLFAGQPDPPPGPSRRPGTPAVDGPAFRSLREERASLERELVLWSLARASGNATQAARLLKITRRHFGTLLDKHGIELARWDEDRRK